MSNYEPYKIAIVGSSGRGKTYSFRNMNPKTCGFINMENKPLPFLNKFEHYAPVKDWSEAYNKLIEFAKMSEITEIVFDSFSAYVDSLIKTARQTKKGFDVWNFYNEKIGELLNIIKLIKKEVIVTAHAEWVENENGTEERRISVKGKEWKGLVEKEFTIVNYADAIIINNKPSYILNLNTDGKSSAKTPPFITDEIENNTIENDANKLLEIIRKVINK